GDWRFSVGSVSVLQRRVGRDQWYGAWGSRLIVCKLRLIFAIEIASPPDLPLRSYGDPADVLRPNRRAVAIQTSSASNARAFRTSRVVSPPSIIARIGFSSTR